MSTDTAPPPSLPAPPSRRSRGGLLLLLCALSACAILGLQLRQSLERERQLAARASSLEVELSQERAHARRAARAIRYGTLGLAEIPPPRLTSTLSLLALDCENLRRQHNELADRFHASLRQSQQLCAIIDEVGAALR